MHMYVTRPEELGVFEVVILKVFQAVAHVGLAAEEFFFPQYFAITPDAAGAGQALWQFAYTQLRPERAGAQFRVGQVQVIAAFHDVIGVLVANSEAQAIGLAIMADHIKAAQLGLFPAVFGERWQ
ncbi:hypothetical protein ALQ16_204009 [Pseudomonas syringae pv. actinidiae]|nr:hypothetical protein ALQ16_204009 [Pseudomonas syringae pv. actinidiae]